MVWHQSIALISELPAELPHSRARLQTPHPLLWFHMKHSVHSCDCISLCVSVCVWMRQRGVTQSTDCAVRLCWPPRPRLVNQYRENLQCCVCQVSPGFFRSWSQIKPIFQPVSAGNSHVWWAYSINTEGQKKQSWINCSIKAHGW